RATPGRVVGTRRAGPGEDAVREVVRAEGVALGDIEGGHRVLPRFRAPCEPCVSWDRGTRYVGGPSRGSVPGDVQGPPKGVRPWLKSSQCPNRPCRTRQFRLSVLWGHGRGGSGP